MAGHGARVDEWIMTFRLDVSVLGLELELERVQEHSRLELDEHN